MSQPPLLPPGESIAPAEPSELLAASDGVDAPRKPLSPYPGLRPFRPDESRLFCGRSQNRIELLSRLEDSRFIAVIGASGSGKSSLVMAGLLPDIAEGLLLTIEPGTSCEVYFKPGRNPFRSLAEGLAKTFHAQGAEPEIERMLRHSSSQGFRKALDRFLPAAPEGGRRAIIVVADQFEEIFRFASLERSEVNAAEFVAERGGVPVLDTVQNEAQAFVDLLLHAYTLREPDVYVVLTMRSDFLHRCEAFDRLPGVISTHQYLTPRPQRDQLADSIAIPATHFGARMQPELVNLILNELSPEQDQLPILEHALARLWQHATRTQTPPYALRVEDYQAIGGIQNALSQHGSEILERIAKISGGTLRPHETGRFFRCLAEWDPAGALIRRPRTVAQVVAESGLTLEQVKQIADEFRGTDNHWLTPMTAEVADLDPERILDLTHESLLRKWDRYSDKSGWMADEKERRDAFRRLCERMSEPMEATPLQQRVFGALRLDLRSIQPAYLSRSQVQRYRETLLTPPEPTEAWANRYGGSWADAKKYLLAVIAKQRAATFSVLVVIIGIIWAIAWARGVAERADEKVKLEREEAAKEARRIQAEHEAENAAREAALAAARAESELLTGEIDSSKRTISELQESRKRAIGELQEVLAQRLAEGELAQELAKEDVTLATLRERYAEAIKAARATTDAASDPPSQGAVAVSGAVSFTPHSKQVEDLTFVEVGGQLHLVTGANDELVALWGLDGATKRTLLKKSATSLVPTRDGRLIVASAGPDLRIVPLEEGAGGEATLTLPNPEPSEGIVGGQMISGGRVLFFTSKGRMGTWIPPHGAPAFFKERKHKGNINAVSYWAQKEWVLASGDDRLATLWKVAPNEPADHVASFEAAAPVRAAGFSFDGAAALIPSGEPVVNVVGLPSGKRVPLRHNRAVLGGKWSPAAMLAATVEVAPQVKGEETGGRVNLWTVPWTGDGRSPARPFSVDLSGHKREVTQFRWAPDGSFLVTADEGGLVLVWQDVPTRAAGKSRGLPLIFPSHKGAVTALAVSADGKFIASGSTDGTVRIVPLEPVIAGPVLTDFGGPAGDSSTSGGLALFDDSDADDPKFEYLFTTQPRYEKGQNIAPRARSLASRLKPEQFYLAARWDYALTSRAFLRNTKVTVRNPATGKSELAQPVDSGPAATTGAVARVSPGLAAALGLKDQDPVEISIDLLGSPGEGVIQMSLPAGLNSNMQAPMKRY